MEPSIRGAKTAWVVTFVIGLIFLAVGGEGLAAFNACLADPECLPDASQMSVSAFFAVLAVGIALCVAAVHFLVAKLRTRGHLAIAN